MLHFDIDFSQLTAAGQELNATPKQVKLALSRALSRTASALRTMSARGLQKELDLRRLAALRKRLKSIKVRAGSDGVALWYGLNDMPVSWFKGTPKSTPTGASFRGQNYPGAFVAKSSYAKTKTIMQRKGKARLHIEEKLLPVEDKAVVYIEDQVFDKLEGIFWPAFERDLRARVKYSIGRQ